MTQFAPWLVRCVVTFLHLNIEDWLTATIFCVVNLLHDPIYCSILWFFNEIHDIFLQKDPFEFETLNSVQVQIKMTRLNQLLRDSDGLATVLEPYTFHSSFHNHRL